MFRANWEFTRFRNCVAQFYNFKIAYQFQNYLLNFEIVYYACAICGSMVTRAMAVMDGLVEKIVAFMLLEGAIFSEMAAIVAQRQTDFARSDTKTEATKPARPSLTE